MKANQSNGIEKYNREQEALKARQQQIKEVVMAILTEEACGVNGLTHIVSYDFPHIAQTISERLTE